MPDPANPYAAPRTASTARRRAPKIAELDAAKLRLLRSKSYHLNIIGGFMAFFTALGVFIVVVFTLITTGPRSNELLLIGWITVVFYGTAMLCAWLRPVWGRTPLFIINLLGLANFPLGTALGLFGIWALQGAAPLFGPDRYRHGSLDHEFQLRSARPSLRRKPPATATATANRRPPGAQVAPTASQPGASTKGGNGQPR